MPKKTAVFEYRETPEAAASIKLVITEPDTITSMRRERLLAEAALETDADSEKKRLRRLYIDVTTATARAEGIPWPLSFEAFCALPPTFTAEWIKAVWRVNVGWLLLAGG
jgi:hypothetical protein